MTRSTIRTTMIAAALALCASAVSAPAIAAMPKAQAATQTEAAGPHAVHWRGERGYRDRHWHRHHRRDGRRWRHHRRPRHDWYWYYPVPRYYRYGW